MSDKSDIEQIKEQERQLVFKNFDENVALALGLDIKARTDEKGKAVAIHIRLWDRTLFHFAMAGTTHDNAEWMRRKANSVERFHRPSYALSLEKGGAAGMKEHWGMDYEDYVFAGGGFPIRVVGAGCIGLVVVSGLPDREDHALVVEALSEAIGVDASKIALPE